MANIVIMDDEAPVRMVLQAVLRSAGHKVTAAADGRQGMQVVARQPIDVAIVDILMPEQDGLETIVQLRRRHPHVKIIAISGAASLTESKAERGKTVDFLAVAKEFGANALLKKPFRRLQLLDLIDELMDETKNGPAPPKR